MEFSELKKKSNLKVLLEGQSGSGKTLSASKVALEVMESQGDVLYLDTEAEGSETMVNLIEDGDYSEDVVQNLTYERVESHSDFKDNLSRMGDYDLIVLDTLDHKHSFVLKAIADAKRDGDADWNEYPQIYGEEKELMRMVGDPESNIVATLDPNSGSDDKPKGAQTNIGGYFSAVIETRKKGDGEWGHKITNWVGKSDWIGKAHPHFPKVVADEMTERM